MKTRVAKAFETLSINSAGMMTRSQKRKFDQQFGSTCRKWQEKKVTMFKPAFSNHKGKKAFTRIFVNTHVNTQKSDVDKGDVWKDWLSPSYFYNYFMQDPLYYVLRHSIKDVEKNETNLHEGDVKKTLSSAFKTFGSIIKGETLSKEDIKTRSVEKCPPLTFLDKLFDEGDRFEEEVYKYFRNVFLTEEEMVQISFGEANDHKKKALVEKTIEHMKKGTPIILQGVLWNEALKTYGVSDMIVRSDYLPKLVSDFQQTKYDEGLDIGNRFHNQFHYRIIDIKSKKLSLRSDGITLQDSKDLQYCKSQVWVYTQALAKIQGYNPQMAYILGKGFEFTMKKEKKWSNQFNERFGVVDFSPQSKDAHYNTEVLQCMEWIREAGKYYYDKLFEMPLPLPRWELYPNMRVKGMYYEEKERLANHLGEISTLYYCGKKSREKAHGVGKYSWKEEELSSIDLGFQPDSSLGKLIDTDIWLTQREKEPIFPRKRVGKSLLHELSYTKRHLSTGTEYVEPDFFHHESRNVLLSIDFEFLNQPIFSTLPKVEQFQIIFMIHVSMKTEKGYVHQNFMVNDLTYFSEKKMLFEFIQFLQEANKHTSHLFQDIELLHWHDAEWVQWSKALRRHPELQMMVPNNVWFTDMLSVVKSVPIMVQHSHGFGLKSYMKHMVDQGILESEGVKVWQECKECKAGGDAVCLVNSENERVVKWGELKSLHESFVMQEVQKYNRGDCMVLLDLFLGLKKYYDL